MFKYLFLDFDGTLVNTLPLTAEACRRFVNEVVGIKKTITDEDVLEVISLVGDKICEHFMDGQKINMDDYNKYYSKFIEDLAPTGKPFPHVKETLKELRNRGIKLFILSNKVDATVRKYADIIFGVDAFDGYQGVIEGVKPKPAPYMINNLYQKYNLKPEDGLLVGDSEVDLQTAINGGIRSVIMSYGYADKNAMAKLPKPDYILDDFSQLLDLLVQ